MADAAALDAHQHFAAARGRAIDRRFRTAAARRRRATGGAFWSCGAIRRLLGSSIRVAGCGVAHHACSTCLHARREPRGAARRSPATRMSSARAVGSSPAAASSAGTSAPSERRLWRSILRRWPKAACVTRSRSARSHGSGAGARHQTHHRGCDFRRRHEGRRLDVEQDARLAAPLRQHRQASVALRCRRGDDAFGDFALEHENGAVVPGRPRLGAEPGDEQRRGDVVGQVGDDAHRAARQQRPRIEGERVRR